MKENYLLDLGHELVIDNFAGGGGASTGIELGIGRPVDIAINHDPEAVAMHLANHPSTHHFCESVFSVDPVAVTGNQPVGLAWFSPDCRHFSKAKGGQPVSKKVRGLAWVVIRYSRRVRPRAIVVENVEEFQDWGPVLKDGKPCPDRRGETFKQFVNELKRVGYTVEWRELRACDYGAPTIRKRLFLLARRDGIPIRWPEPTHGDPESLAVKGGRLLPWRTAAECIDWAVPCPSIFGRKKPLAENTMRRIAKGIERFVLNAAEPFIVKVNHGGLGFRGQSVNAPFQTITGKNGAGVVAAFLAQHNTGVVGRDARAPVSTVTSSGSQQQLVTGHMIKMRGTCKDGQDARQPMPTITAGGNHVGEVRAFLTKYYGSSVGQDLQDPMHTVTSRARLGLVTVHGQNYQIVDIGMRMLSPRELYRAQGFPDDYIIDPEVNGKPLTKTAQVRMCGNSVCPDVAAALVRANFAHEMAWKEVI